MSSVEAVILVPVAVVAVDLVVYELVRKLGKRSTGVGTKYEPFTGGEGQVPRRGVYQSGLFVFAVLFMIVESFALLLAGSYLATSDYYPLLYLGGGTGVIFLITLWFMTAGGGGMG